jgi:hypothetical protein
MISTEKLKQDYGKEMALVILCCRLHFQTVNLEDINLFIAQHPPVNELFLKLCKLHKVRAVVFKMILQADIASDLKATIKQELLIVTTENWKRIIETERIISLLNKHNITVWVYKGAAFTKQFYSDVNERESNDIDFVIKKTDLDNIIEILEKDSYYADIKDVREYLGENYFHYYKDFSFIKFADQKRLFLIEMHWRISENHFGIPQSADSLIYDHKEEIILMKNAVLAVNKTSHFLSVFIHHAIKDTFRNLKALMDIAQCFTHHSPEVQWDKVDAKINEFKLNKSFELSIFLSQQLFGIQLPSRQNIHVNNKTGLHFINQLCAGELINLNKKIDMNYIHNQLLVRDSLSIKFSFLVNYIKCLFLPMAPDFRLFRLPKKLFFMYPVLKPFRPLFKN